MRRYRHARNQNHPGSNGPLGVIMGHLSHRLTHRLSSRLPHHFLAATITLAALPSLAASPAFIEATSELDGGKPRTSKWNAVDGKEGTMWCSKKTPDQKEAINFTFESPVFITHLGLKAVTSGEGVDKATRRPRIVYVADVDHRVEAKFKDVGDMQVLELMPPAAGTRVVVEFAEGYDGATPDAPLCVAEIVLRDKKHEVTADLSNKVRGINTPGRKLLHLWHDDISAPTRTLLFNVDGSFMFHYEDLLGEAKPVTVKGKWSAGATTVTLETGGKSYRLKSRFTKIDDGDDNQVVLTLQGDAPHPSMVDDFRPAPLRLP